MTIKPSKNTVRINEDISAKEVRLIGFGENQLGVVSLTEAMQVAFDSGVDLVEVASNSNPPVCKVMDYGKHVYEQNKKKKGSAKVKPIKQIEVRPSTDEGDLKTKIGKIEKFLLAGHKVKLAVKYKGREMSHQKIGLDKLASMIERLTHVGRSEGRPVMEGRKHQVVLSPLN